MTNSKYTEVENPQATGRNLTAAERYEQELLPAMTIDELMDALVRAAGANQYGSHGHQISLIRAEITRRATR